MVMMMLADDDDNDVDGDGAMGNKVNDDVTGDWQRQGLRQRWQKRPTMVSATMAMETARWAVARRDMTTTRMVTDDNDDVCLSQDVVGHSHYKLVQW